MLLRLKKNLIENMTNAFSGQVTDFVQDMCNAVLLCVIEGIIVFLPHRFLSMREANERQIAHSLFFFFGNMTEIYYLD
jgi:hypothetical protein